MIMNDYELLLNQVEKEVPVIELPLLPLGFEGNYYDGAIFIDSSLSLGKKKEVLSEEYGHYKTSVGKIINYDQSESRKQELKARRFAVDLIVTLDQLIACHQEGLTNIYECADYLNVSVDCFLMALYHYQAKFGQYHYYKGKTFVFNDSHVAILDRIIS